MLSAQGEEVGIIAGKVVNTWDGVALPGVVVTVKGTTLAAQTDSSGNYELRSVPPGEQVMRLSKPGFASAVVTEVRVVPGQTTTVNGHLRPEFYEMEEFEVSAEVFTEQVEKINFERQNAASMMESLGSDFLSRVGAANAAESIAKVSGTTIVDGKFAVIRGLNDRYVSTTLNGARLPSADPYRQSASLDLFPAQVIDRVVVAKTFTPDQQGTDTGGGIDIITKSFPEKPFLSLSLGGAYNTQATLNDRFLSYRGGGLDWAGLDDGTRALSDSVAKAAPVGQALPAAPISSGTIGTPGYFANTQNAALLDRIAREMGPTQFAPTRETAPFNHNFSLGGGGSSSTAAGRVGYFGGASYKRDFNFYENGITRRYQNGLELKNSYADARAVTLVNWAGMANLAYQPFENHELGFTFFYNQNGTDQVRQQDRGFEQTSEAATFRKSQLYYVERNLNTFQFKGDHVFPQVESIKFDWLVALTGTTQDEPDARFFNDMDAGGGPVTGGNSVPIPNSPTRYFRNLDENNLNAKLDWTVPFENWTAEEGKVKFGLFDSSSSRTFTDRAFYYPGGGGYGLDPNNFLTEQNLGLDHVQTNYLRGQPRSLTFIWDQYLQVFDSSYSGDLGVQATYLMTEFPILSRLKLVTGARYESTDLGVAARSYRASSITGTNVNDTSIRQGDLLPSVGLIYAFKTNMNLRVSFSQTMARPSFREMAAYFSYDPVINDYVEGNPELKLTSINNYDLRWEWFRRGGELVSFSLFYKDMRGAIERGDIKQEGDVITWFNRDEAKLYGVELEARTSLAFLGSTLELFSLGGNLSLVQSEVKLTATEMSNKGQFFPNISSTRSLYDQSPYIVNLDLSYSQPRWGTSGSLIFNMAGPRITITKLNTEDVFEQPAPSLDFVFSQRLFQHATAKFTARNLLDPSLERTYGEKGLLLYDSYRKGRTFGLAFSYDF